MTTFFKAGLFILFFVSGAGCFTLKVQGQNDQEQLAKDLAENGEYALAVPYFEDLVNLYPADKELNYYLGMCLTETAQFSEKAKTALQISLGNDTPAKSLYYLAECFHAGGNFQEALNYYQQFDEKARNKVKKTTRLAELMELCREQVNPFRKPEVEAENLPHNDLTGMPVTSPASAPEEPEEVAVPEEMKDSLINFQVNSTIKYLRFGHFKNGSSLQAFIRALREEQEVQALLAKTNQLREKYHSACDSTKAEIANEILELEKEIYVKNTEIKQGYYEARAKEMDYWEHAGSSTRQAFIGQIRFLEDSISEAKKAARLTALKAEKPIILPDSLFNRPGPDQVAQPEQGVTYKIQIGAYSKSPPDWVQRLFKKLSVIRRIDEYTDDNGVTVYTVGTLKSYEDAVQMQSQVRMEGVKDAFIAAYLSGKRISVNEARKMTEQ